MMKKVFLAVGLLLIPAMAKAITYQSVRASTSTVLDPGLQVGAMNLSSGTIRNFTTSTATIKNETVDVSTITNLTVGTLNGAIPGDITSVTAGYGLTGGGSSGDVTLNLDGGTTSYIQNRDTLQSGTTLYTSSGTIQDFNAVRSTITTSNATSATSTNFYGGTSNSLLGPAYSFTGDNDNGLSYRTTNTIGLVAGGVLVSTIASTGMSVLGTTTNDSANTGYVGQYVESVVANQNVPTTAQYGDITSISLTAGDWDVTVMGNFLRNGATWNYLAVGVSPTSGNSGSGLTLGSNLMDTGFASSSTTPLNQSLTVSSFRVSISGTTTYYGKVYAEYSVATPRVNMRLSARRVR